MNMKKLSQLHIDVSSYFFAMTVTVIFCFFLSAMCYIELCARETLLSSGGILLGFWDAVIEWVDGVIS